MGRPPKKGRGRPKGGKSRKEINREASKKYRGANPEKIQGSKTKYKEENLDKIREYTETYKATYPDKVKESRKSYIEQKPEKVKESKKSYIEQKPEKVKESRKSYNEQNPEKVKESDRKYVEQNPEKVKASKQTHEETHQDDRKNTYSSHNKIRKVPAKLRKYRPYFGNLSGKALDDVDLYSFKFPGSLSRTETYKCPKCGALLYEEERGREKWCCGGGELIPVIPRLPPIDDCDIYKQKKFLEHTRAYNNLFAFSAFGTSKHYKGFKSGVQFVKVQGKVYHRIFPLDYTKSMNNSALWIEDNEERIRIAAKQKLDSNMVKKIEKYLKEVNPFVDKIRHLAKENAEDAYLVFEKTSRKTHGNVLGDVPVDNEISAVIKTGKVEGRKVVIWKTGSKAPQTIHFLDPAYEPLQYPLIFPHGTAGWADNTTIPNTKNNKKLTMLKYYRYRYFTESRLTFLRRLGQEYFVDAWARIEDYNLDFIRNQQKSILRIAKRCEFDDETIYGETGSRHGVVGRIYLPSSFTCSPRYYEVQYHNSIALVNRKGKPSFFLTITCNPNWEEIKSSLNFGETSTDRPDITMRVFNIKLHYLLDLIRCGRLFGPLDYLIYVIEFQKRGLPHAHITFRVKGGGPQTSIEINKFIRATVPPRDEANGRLSEIILKHNVHNECRSLTPAEIRAQVPARPCMENNKCSKGFPKAPNETTYINNRGFPIYRRPCEDVVEVPMGRNRTRQVDDRWIVPYNAVISLMMDCHANLEIATGPGTVKYLMKYVYKGPDRARYFISREDVGRVAPKVDEALDYREGRTIGAAQAFCRLFEFHNRESTPKTESLPIHLPGEDSIVHKEGKEESAVKKTVSKQTLYLERPKVPELNNLTYVDFYENYFVEAKKPSNENRKFYKHVRGKFVYKRILNECVCRLYQLFPGAGESYYLRLLLLKTPANSYEELRTVDGITYNTFQEAAEARGFFALENEACLALKDAIEFKIGKQLRYFFFTLIIFDAPAQILWNKFKLELIDDLLRSTDNNVELAENMALIEIKRLLQSRGKTLAELGLPDVIDDSSEVSRETLRWDRSQCLEFFNHWDPLLNPSQKSFSDDVLGSIYNPTSASPKLFYLDGPGGTGKTLVLNVIMSKLRAEGRIVLPCAFTGIAALNYKGGTTAHSLFKLPFNPEDTAVCNISFTSQRADLIRQADLIIWDEISTVHNTLFDAVDRTLRDLHRNSLPFGGKIIIFAGDFRQIPPIVESNTAEDVCAASVKFNSLWPLMRVYKLTTPQRLIAEDDFSEFLLEVGEGRAPVVRISDENLISLGSIQLVDTVEDLIEFVFPTAVLQDPVQCCSRAILSTTNSCVRDINQIVLENLDGETLHFYSADSCLELSEDQRPIATPDTLHSYSAPGVPNHDLELKIGAVCYIMRNICFEKGLVNGTKVIIRRAFKFCIEVEVPSWPNSRENTVFIPRINFIFTVGRHSMKIQRKQFPLRVANCMTVHKIQGQTLDRVGLDLRSDVFSHGQLYVALSRIRQSTNLRVLVPHQRVINGQAFTKNVVFEDLL